jgi:2,3-bisphosphoglycerate-dependent phosphoglycerate mutase
MPHLALVRHGQSQWNLENRFTGWVDVDLSEKGRAEAKKAGVLLASAGVSFDACQTSVLKRAIRTLWLALDEMDRMWLPVARAWELNERHYGGLTGLNKAEIAEKHGAEQVKIWRRSFDIAPPPLPEDSPYDMAGDPRYRALGVAVPRTESLKLTLARVAPYYHSMIAPQLRSGRSLLISAHGNSLRALVKILLEVSDSDIVSVEIPTGNPLLFEFDQGATRPRSVRYLDGTRAEKIPPL